MLHRHWALAPRLFQTTDELLQIQQYMLGPEDILEKYQPRKPPPSLTVTHLPEKLVTKSLLGRHRFITRLGTS